MAAEDFADRGATHMPNTHTLLAGSKRPPPPNCKRVGPVPPNTRVDATITLKGPHLPTPRADGHALSREEIAKKFGVPKATVQKVTRVLESYKLQVVEVTQGGRSLKVKGSARSVTEAFHAVLGMYEVREARGKGPIREFRAREGVLHIPKALSG